MRPEILIAAVSTGIAVAVPFVTILIGMFLNNKRLDGMEKRFDSIDRQLELMHTDMRQFYHLTGNMDARITVLEKRP